MGLCLKLKRSVFRDIVKRNKNSLLVLMNITYNCWFHVVTKIRKSAVNVLAPAKLQDVIRRDVANGFADVGNGQGGALRWANFGQVVYDR